MPPFNLQKLSQKSSQKIAQEAKNVDDNKAQTNSTRARAKNPSAAATAIPTKNLETSKDRTEEECNMIRIHPILGGTEQQFGSQKFRGVSGCVFFQLDLYDASTVQRVSRKINMTIQLSPDVVSPNDFFRTFAEGKLVPGGGLPQKCHYHGDYETGLKAQQWLLEKVKEDVSIDGTKYQYHSIGIAAGKKFASFNHRKTSHMEIKFKRQVDTTHLPSEGDFLVLNIHLSPQPGTTNFDLKSCVQRLKNCIGLFYDLSINGKEVDLMRLKELTLDNFGEHRYSICRPTDVGEIDGIAEHNASIRSFDKYLFASSKSSDPIKRGRYQGQVAKRQVTAAAARVRDGISFCDAAIGSVSTCDQDFKPAAVAAPAPVDAPSSDSTPVLVDSSDATEWTTVRSRKTGK